ncbi:D-2-hydroxyacid dehydrogenase family protein [Nocardioides mesophilus]|uniref:D-2-hydroxyacid dehydrogenase family protein n=1 Tax=Nocardioides mesophilus TaxID=433659 RepID=A0A7G9R718_9ACTN|nr:D-2-hydroxyacid dehydrogenase family protein [Nocardioides mesophilus]QNN51393.1 D-2-hydroxyacid dehydrogenase family protein [Nocardioides mesophilus]
MSGPLRAVVLDDYAGAALGAADWSVLGDRVRVDVLTEHIPDPDELVARLSGYDVVVAMRERTPLPAVVLDRLTRLRLLVTTGMRNASIDVAAARANGVTVCGTRTSATSTVEHTWALILGLARHLEQESAHMRAGEWQSTQGIGLAGKQLGVVGLGRLGGEVARIGQAFGMSVVAWSTHLTQERADAVGVAKVGFDELLSTSDVVTLHLVLGDRSRGLVGARELELMKPTALLVNTSRGPIVQAGALLAALQAGTIGGAALDVYDQEPLPADDPLRSAPRSLLTPHLGYVTDDGWRTFFADVVEDVAAFLAGAPVRELP